MDIFLVNQCMLDVLNREIIDLCDPFSCGDSDLDDFFRNDAGNYDKQLLGKSYCYRLQNDFSVIVCAFTLSNSSIEARNLPNNRKKKLTEHIPYEKSLSSYPATLIGRLGINKEYRGQGIGSELLYLVKSRLTERQYFTGCRYLTVDAYNNDATLKFYESNGFKCLFSSAQQEKEYIGLSNEKELKTRLMYFDLILV